MIRGFRTAVAGLMLIALLAGCSIEKSYKDGVYDGESEPDKRGAYGAISITVEDGKISDVKYQEYQGDGSLKDENYKKDAGPEIYEIAQKAVAGVKTYGDKLIEVQDVGKVDAVTGATVSNEHFRNAAWNALEGAKQ